MNWTEKLIRIPKLKTDKFYKNGHIVIVYKYLQKKFEKKKKHQKNKQEEEEQR